MGGPDLRDRVQTTLDINTPALLGYFLRRVEIPDDAADLLSDTLLIIWRKRAALPRYNTEARMWMFGVARKVLLTHRRTRRRRSALHDKLRHELARTPQPQTVDTDHLDVRAALTQLDRVDQEIIRLTYWDGFTLAHVKGHEILPTGGQEICLLVARRSAR
ncbi:MAG: sigma-70 family RNA polymerase sigma factor [Actinobacteria bacterium]|nr:sigma-70 family RNA polymerase sigma factor [Actinomycetota bacterium]